MKSAMFLGLATSALAAPTTQLLSSRTTTTCPDINGSELTSNNNQVYDISCAKWINSDPIRIVDVENGINGCLTACDGTVGCKAVQFIATDEIQQKGSCTVFPTTELQDGSSNSWTIAIPRVEPTRFNGLAIHSGSDIQYASVNANGASFWLGKNTTTYCPASVVPSCPNTTDTLTTVFTKSADTASLSLDVSVPGGQQVYVTPAGELKFTQAHSASTGDNGTVTGFTFSDDGLHLLFEGNDWFACSTSSSDNAYQILAASRANGTDCLGFAFRLANTTAPSGVWQYQ